MTSLDERQIIRIFQMSFGGKKFAADDVETFKIGKKIGVIKIDTLVASTDVLPRMKMSDVARKSVVASVSDFASKGVKPLYCIISVSLPKNFSKSKINQLASGFRAASKEFGFRILGGDTNKANDLVISVVLFGLTERITPRKGAKQGDVVVVSGPFGLNASALKIFLEGKKTTPEFRRQAEKSVMHPMPRLGFGIDSAPLLSASMDSSDGLSSCLVELAKQSNKRLVITKLPVACGVKEFASVNKLDLFDLVLNGGEEYEIVATAPLQNFQKLAKIAKNHKIKLIKIGIVQKGRGVFLHDGKSKMEIIDRGWSHKF
ncbi:MAG: thiamine-phosphate kinase [Nitrososphaera sp.]|jgi:thiamine-monophosphate kinase